MPTKKYLFTLDEESQKIIETLRKGERSYWVSQAIIEKNNQLIEQSKERLGKK